MILASRYLCLTVQLFSKIKREGAHSVLSERFRAKNSFSESSASVSQSIESHPTESPLQGRPSEVSMSWRITSDSGRVDSITGTEESGKLDSDCKSFKPCCCIYTPSD